MALPVFKTEAEVPEAMKPFYIQAEDGSWKVKPEEIPDVTKLETTLQSERTLRETEEKARKKAENDLAELRRKAKAKDEGISDEALDRIRTEEATARKPILDENETLKAENRKLKLTDRVQKLALEAGVLPDRLEDAMVLLDPRTDLSKEGSIVVKDKQGNVSAEKIEDFLSKTFKAEKPWLYAGSGAQGGGATGSSTSDAPPASPATGAAQAVAVRSAF